jgi:hypothetical protein
MAVIQDYQQCNTAVSAHHSGGQIKASKIIKQGYYRDGSESPINRNIRRSQAISDLHTCFASLNYDSLVTHRTPRFKLAQKEGGWL